MTYYILNGKEIIPTKDAIVWGKFMNEIEKRKVKDEQVGNYRISTVFLGIDHGFGRYGEPVLFETMIFPEPPTGEYQERCNTWDEAEKMHEVAKQFLLKETECPTQQK